jgi:hypothetical protein
MFTSAANPRTAHSFAGFVSSALKTRVALVSKMLDTCLIVSKVFACVYKDSLSANSRPHNETGRHSGCDAFVKFSFSSV